MALFLITFILMFIAVAAMAVGVLAGRQPIRGSCGGLNNISGLENACSACSEPCDKRKKALENMRNLSQ